MKTHQKDVLNVNYVILECFSLKPTSSRCWLVMNTFFSACVTIWAVTNEKTNQYNISGSAYQYVAWWMRK